MRRTLLSLLLLVPPIAGVQETAATIEPRDLAEILRPIRERHDLPALGGVIVTVDGVLALGVDGVRQRGRTEAVTTGDLFHLGSCTKAMTATLAGVFVERGELAWETTVGEAFEDLGDGLHEGWKDVTLDQLLSHWGGAPFNLADYGTLPRRVWALEGKTVEQRRLVVEGVLAEPPPHPPGKKYLYSNDGYVIAGAMIERVSKKTWEETIRGELFEPLGMHSAGFGPPGTPGAFDQPIGHRESGKPIGYIPGADNPGAYGPAGTVHCTLADWARFVALHLSEGEDAVVTEETLARLHRGHEGSTPPYALGWLLHERGWGGGQVLNHDGTNTNWYCVVWAAPKRGFAVLAATNQGGAKAIQACDEVVSALILHHLAHLHDSDED